MLKPFKNNINESPSEQQQQIFNTFQIFDYESFYVAGKTIAQSREGSDISDAVERSHTVSASNTLGNELASELLVFSFLGK